MDPVNKEINKQTNKQQTNKQTFRSPDILAPANIPVAAGKKIAKTEMKLFPFV